MVGLIVARSKNNVIGKNGEIPWKIKGEQKQFKELTTENVVVMGRRSYEEIGHPLPNRINIVVSNTENYQAENLVTVKSLSEALQYASTHFPEKDVFIAGGYRLFQESIPLVDKMFITEVDTMVENGDTFFPPFEEDKYQLEIGETGGEGTTFTRTTYTKIKELEIEENDYEKE